jgi:hypothetical protein
MAIVAAPANDPTSELRPITWVVSTLIDTTVLGVVEKARATIVVDGVSTVIDYNSPTSSSGVPAATTYVFTFDVQRIVQDLKSPIAQFKTNCFGTPSTAYSVQATNCYGTVQVTFEYFYIDNTTKIPTNQGVTDVSATFNYLLAARQHEDTMSLANYIPTFASFKPFLTNAATTQNIGLTESLFISTVASTGNAVRVITYDQFGVQIDLGVFSAPGANFDQLSFGIGPNELRVTVWDLAGAVNIDNPLVSYYTVAYGQGAIFFEFTDVYTFNIVDCAGGVRLHWLNRLGGTDAYTFKGLSELEQIATSDTAQKPLNWLAKVAEGNTLSDTGTFKINNTATISRNIQSLPVTPAVANWLAELQSSAEVYREVSGGFIRINPKDITQKLETDNSTGLMLVNIDTSGVDANQRIVQSN